MFKNKFKKTLQKNPTGRGFLWELDKTLDNFAKKKKEKMIELNKIFFINNY